MSDIESSEIGVGRRAPQDKFSSDPTDPPPNGGHARPEREGLPATYRMRADAHYVDQLASRRDRAERGEASRHVPSAIDSTDRQEAADQRDRRSDRVMTHLSEEIAAITAAAAMLAADGPALARRVSADLVRAHAWRASWLLRASALIDGRHRAQTRPKPIGSILEQVRQGLTAECRLAGITLHVYATDWNTVVAADEQAVVAGITGAVFATLGLTGQAEGAAIRIAVESGGGELRSIEVSQDDVPAPPSASLRFFDTSWADRPGGSIAGLGALTARAVANQLGGSATFGTSADRRGTVIRLNLSKI